MADTENKGAVDWQLNKATLTHKKNKTYEITAGLINFSYYESLENLNPTATIVFSDNKTEMNCKDGDKIEINLMTTAHTDADEWVHVFDVENVETKTVDGAKIYSLHLITPHSIRPSTYNYQKALQGTAKQILTKVFDDAKGKTEALPIVTDGNEPFNNFKFMKGKKKVTDIVHNICTGSIPASGKTANTCGYFLWGSKKGIIGNKDTYNLHFKSIDSLLSVGGTHGGDDAEYEYYESNNASTVDIPAQLVISNFEVSKRGNCKKMCDDGVFKAKVILYNLDSKKYSKRSWDLRDHWDSWGHIARTPGTDPWESSEIVEEYMASDTPAKTFMLEISHEKFHDDKDPANPGQIGPGETDEGEKTQSATFQDWDEETIVQYHARYATMLMSTSNMTIPGNQYLHAGDKVKIYLRDSRPDAKTDVDSYDKELSGHYLIYKMRQYYSMVPKKECYSALTLVRDTLNKNC